MHVHVRACACARACVPVHARVRVRVCDLREVVTADVRRQVWSAELLDDLLALETHLNTTVQAQVAFTCSGRMATSDQDRTMSGRDRSIAEASTKNLGAGDQYIRERPENVLNILV